MNSQAETDRQTADLIQGFSMVFSQITSNVKDDGRQNDPFAFAAAFVRLQADFLASIDNAHDRKVMRKSMERLLPIELSKTLAREGKH